MHDLFEQKLKLRNLTLFRQEHHHIFSTARQFVIEEHSTQTKQPSLGTCGGEKKSSNHGVSTISLIKS